MKDKRKNKKQKKDKSNIEDGDDRFEKLPQGVPGRKSFVVLPKMKKQFWRPEALALRQVLTFMIPLHAVCLLVFDIWAYDFEIFAMVFDCAFLWFSFYGYMTLNKVTTGVYVVLLIFAPLIAITHF